MKKYLSGMFVIVATMLLLASAAFASADYTVTDIKLTDLTGSPIEYTSGSCMVNVSVKKTPI